MVNGKESLQENVVGNKIQTFLIVSVSLKYGKLKGTMSSCSKIWDVK